MKLINLNDAIDPLTPTKKICFCFRMLEISRVYFLAISSVFWGKGLYYANIMAESVMIIVVFLIFQRGK